MDHQDYAFPVLQHLTKIIAEDLSVIASEQSYPGMDADRSDQTIMDRKKRVEALREIREHFEDIMSGVV